MKLSEFESFLRMIVPSANNTRITPSQLQLVINKGVRDVNSIGKVLTKSGYFNAIADSGEYVISSHSTINDFVTVGESGLWYNKGSAASPNYVELWGATKPYLNKKNPNWHTAGSSDPNYAVFETNLITVQPKPSADLDDAFFMPDYVYKPTTMTNADHYPFSGSETEFTDLEVLDDAIIAYVRWILGLSIGEKQEGILTKKEYEQTVTHRTALLRRRPDLNNNHDFKI